MAEERPEHFAHDIFLA